MLRAISLFGFLAMCWLAASTAEACSYQLPRNPGETKAHAYERRRQANQDRYWADADTIFVGRVIGLMMGDRGLEVSVLPRRSIKGDVGTDVVTYSLDGIEVSCDRAAFPDYDKVGLFYASRENDRLVVFGMLGPNDIKDEVLRARVLRELEPGELTTLTMETPTEDRWPMVLAGLIAFFAFIGGIVIGRQGRKRTVA
ncbi:hypothetical protein [Brevundimonas sp. DWR2-3-1b1]|uniref:hypothetical protein n=1 Tax=unclassified Brevundimonas TaxID=2622653 RepID=UPI003CF0EFAC